MKAFFAIGLMPVFFATGACNSKPQAFRGAPQSIAYSVDQIEDSEGQTEEDCLPHEAVLSTPFSELMEASLKVIGDKNFQMEGVAFSDLNGFYWEHKDMFDMVAYRYDTFGEMLTALGMSTTFDPDQKIDKAEFTTAMEQLNQLIYSPDYEVVRDLLRNPDAMFEPIPDDEGEGEGESKGKGNDMESSPIANEAGPTEQVIADLLIGYSEVEIGAAKLAADGLCIAAAPPPKGTTAKAAAAYVSVFYLGLREGLNITVERYKGGW